jgi:hypothetical protein
MARCETPWLREDGGSADRALGSGWSAGTQSYAVTTSRVADELGGGGFDPEIGGMKVAANVTI